MSSKEIGAGENSMDILILCEQFCEYAISFRGQSKATIRRYRHVIRCFCKFTGMSSISEVTEESVRKLFYYGRTERKWSVNTFLVYHVSLLVFFRWCVKQGLMERNPIEGIEKPKLEKRSPQMDINYCKTNKGLHFICRGIYWKKGFN